ncbi:hypothetical protein MLD38_022990 [Melastoma candidum]|uniref:Uncharacterized protein n=1 Tax=Melastoma candidum TaxID=119954 RepID=A0ACB9QMW4_9MYRT|nr:hypothetical protein MLD38_022990 [Melastoma candidum]
MAIGIYLQKLLNAWNIRCMVLLSFSVQIILSYASPFRRTSRSWAAVLVWSTYLLADSVAIYTTGLISNTVRTSSATPLQVDLDILALWASVLLIHMGGPGSITAYSLEDNSLWLRHIVRLVGQLAVIFYIFLKSFPGNNLMVPTLLVLVTGIMKYGERSRALFLASLENLKGSVGQRLFLELEENVRSQRYYFFERFRGMIVDLLPSPSELQESRQFFKEIDTTDALEVISGELKLIYEVLYTKIMAVHSKWGIFCRVIFYGNMAATVVLFCHSSKDQFAGIDVIITYCLLSGVFVVDMSQDSDYMDSDSSHVAQQLGICWLPDRIIMALTLVPVFLYFNFFELLNGCDSKLWSERMGAFNLLDCSVKKYCRSKKQKQHCPTRFLDKAVDMCGFNDRLDNLMYTTTNCFQWELWVFLFEGLKKKASGIDSEIKAREVYHSKGEAVLQEMDLAELEKSYMKDFDYGKALLCWHIATEICYNVDEDENDEKRKCSKILSDYLTYLLIHEPKLTAAVAGITHERYDETCLEVKASANKLGAENLKDFCAKALEVPDVENGEGGYNREHAEERVRAQNGTRRKYLAKDSQ